MGTPANRAAAYEALQLARRKHESDDDDAARKMTNKSLHLFETGEARAFLVYLEKFGVGSAIWKRMQGVLQANNFYEVFGCAPAEAADLASLKRMYHALSLELHPDKNHHKLAERAFQRVNEAFAELSDPHKRAAYDRDLRQRPPPPPPRPTGQGMPKSRTPPQGRPHWKQHGAGAPGAGASGAGSASAAGENELRYQLTEARAAAQHAQRQLEQVSAQLRQSQARELSQSQATVQARREVESGAAELKRQREANAALLKERDELLATVAAQTGVIAEHEQSQRRWHAEHQRWQGVEGRLRAQIESRRAELGVARESAAEQQRRVGELSARLESGGADDAHGDANGDAPTCRLAGSSSEHRDGGAASGADGAVDEAGPTILRLIPLIDDGRIEIRVALSPDLESTPLIFGRDTRDKRNQWGLADPRVSRRHVRLAPAAGMRHGRAMALGVNPVGVQPVDGGPMVQLTRGEEAVLRAGDVICLVIEERAPPIGSSSSWAMNPCAYRVSYHRSDAPVSDADAPAKVQFTLGASPRKRVRTPLAAATAASPQPEGSRSAPGSRKRQVVVGAPLAGASPDEPVEIDADVDAYVDADALVDEDDDIYLRDGATVHG